MRAFCAEPASNPRWWFQLLSESVRFPSREEEEQLRNKLQGLTVEDIEHGRGRPEVPTQMEGKTEKEGKTETKARQRTRPRQTTSTWLA